MVKQDKYLHTKESRTPSVLVIILQQKSLKGQLGNWNQMFLSTKLKYTNVLNLSPVYHID